MLEQANGVRTATRVLPTGAELYRQGDICATCFFVTSGWIALSTLLDDGGCQIVDFAVPGTFLGFPCLSGIPRWHSARCITPVQVVCYPEAQLSRAVIQNAKLAILLYGQAVSQEWRAHDHLVNLGLRSARERIARLLLELYVRLRGHTPNKVEETIHIPLTQCHIGEAVGLTNVHVCRTLHLLREQNVAQFVKYDLKILNPNALVRAAGVSGLPSGVPSALNHLPVWCDDKLCAQLGELVSAA
ncbi:Crp/Fnr family transcriptional regulator [Bradyrhizobium cenepequi]